MNHDIPVLSHNSTDFDSLYEKISNNIKKCPFSSRMLGILL